VNIRILAPLSVLALVAAPAMASAANHKTANTHMAKAHAAKPAKAVKAN
jgi:hypothetical protein